MWEREREREAGGKNETDLNHDTAELTLVFIMDWTSCPSIIYDAQVHFGLVWVGSKYPDIHVHSLTYTQSVSH